MIAPRLTDELARSAKPLGRAYYLTERGNGVTVRGFGLRVHPSGVRTYVLRAAGKTVTIGSPETLSAEEARRRAREKKVELVEGPPAPGIVASRKSLARLYEDDYLPSLRARVRAGDLRRSTLEHYAYLWGAVLLPALGKLRLSEVDVARLEEWKRSESGRPVLFNRAAQQLSACLAYGVRVGALPANAAADVELYGERPSPRHLSDDEIRRWGRALREMAGGRVSPEASAALWTLFYTGARPGEVVHAKRAWLVDGELRLPEAKGDRPGRTRGRAIRIPSAAMQELLVLDMLHGADREELIPGVVSLRHPFAAVCREAGIEDASPKVLRHVWRSVAPEAGVNRDHVRQLGGWANNRTPDRVYSHERPALAGAAEAIAGRLEELSQ